MNRYKVIEESATGHCCFEASVVDIAHPLVGGDDAIMEDSYNAVCECLDIEDAEKIALLLNQTATIPSEEDIARGLLNRSSVEWDDLPEYGVHSIANEHLPGETVDTPGKDHWMAIARQIRATLLRS